MDFETIIVGLIGWGLGHKSGTQKANDYVQNLQQKENDLLRVELFKMQVKMLALEAKKNDETH